MSKLNSKEREYLVDSIIELNNLEAVSPSKRTEEQQNLIDEIRTEIEDNRTELFTALTDRGFTEVTAFLDENDFIRWRSILASEKTMPPRIPSRASSEQIDDLIDTIYTAQTTIGLTLEEIEDYYICTSRIVKRAEAIFKTLTCLNKDWQNQGLFFILVDDIILHSLTRLESMREMYKMRISLLEDCRRDVSRKLTIYTNNQIDVLGKTDPVSALGGASWSRQKSKREN